MNKKILKLTKEEKQTVENRINYDNTINNNNWRKEPAQHRGHKINRYYSKNPLIIQSFITQMNTIDIDMFVDIREETNIINCPTIPYTTTLKELANRINKNNIQIHDAKIIFE